MNQQRIDRVKGVEKITEHGAALAKDAVVHCQQRLDEQHARLQQLSDYLQEYAAGLGFAAGGSSQAFALQNYRAFMGKIEQTIEHQKTVVAQIEAELSACQNTAAEANSQHRSVGKLRGRFEVERNRIQGKQEQGVNDAHAAQLRQNPLSI
ncbi:MAG: flagellar export protein FliJ [Halothiobacillus sp.]